MSVMCLILKCRTKNLDMPPALYDTHVGVREVLKIHALASMGICASLLLRACVNFICHVQFLSNLDCKKKINNNNNTVVKWCIKKFSQHSQGNYLRINLLLISLLSVIIVTYIESKLILSLLILVPIDHLFPSFQFICILCHVIANIDGRMVINSMVLNNKAITAFHF